MKWKVLSASGLFLLFGIFMASCSFQISKTANASIPSPYTHTTTPTVVPTSIEASSEPQQPKDPISKGEEQILSSDLCFDLDEGVSLPSGHPDCDFSVEPLGDTASKNIRFSPLSKSSFGFEAVYWDAPAVEQCSSHQAFSPASQSITTEQQYYVCYQTGEGYLGYLLIRSYAWPELTFDWFTYDKRLGIYFSETDIVPTETKTPVPDDIHRQNNNIWVRLFEGIDLDYGDIKNMIAGGFDFQVSPGSYDDNGLLQSLILKPAVGAGFIFSLPFSQAPTLADCQKSDNYQNNPVELNQSRRYFCYQTDRGRFGYLFFHEINPSWGIRIDWKTWTGTEESRLTADEISTLPEETYQAELLAETALVINTYRPKVGFKQTWQIGNLGRTTWSSRFSLVFSAGNQMGGVEKQAFRVSVEPGDILKITLTLVAPDQQGTYVGEYWLEDTEGNRFGLGPQSDQPLRVVINVGEPGLTMAEGVLVEVASGQCYDLDQGYVSINDPACDFSIQDVEDTSLILLKSTLASFDFTNPFTTQPRLGQCQIARLSSGERMLDIKYWYVCYKTDQGNYGWLYILESGDGKILFDWKTYQ